MYGIEFKQHRQSRGITQTDLAKATGIPQRTISWIESDKGLPTIQNCVILADFYGISIDELIGHEVKKNW